MPRKLITLTFVILCAHHTHAQNDDAYDITPSAFHDRYHVNLVGAFGIPSTELKEAVKNDFGNIGIGFDISLLFNPFGKKKPSPILPGIDFSYVTYGVDKIEEAPSNPPLKTTFNIYNISAAFRLMPKQSPGFSPFIDGMIGSRIFNTRTKIDKNLLHTVVNDDQPEVVNTSNDAGLCYTAGIGFFHRKVKTLEDELGISFTLRVLYSWGDDTEYIIRDSIALDSDNFVTYETGRTRTNMLLIHIGVTLH